MTDHVFILGESFLNDDLTAGCTCGWEAATRFDAQVDAINAWENHCDVVFMEATEPAGQPTEGTD